MDDKYIFFALAFSFIFVSAFILLSFSEVNIPKDRFTSLYFNTTIVEGNGTTLEGKYLTISNDSIALDSSTYREGDSFFIDEKGYTIGMIANNSVQLYNYTKKTNGKIYFDFAIENFEGADKDYKYKIFIDKENVLEGNESIKSNEKVIIQKTTPFNGKGTHRLSILLNTGAEIHFNFSSVK